MGENQDQKKPDQTNMPDRREDWEQRRQERHARREEWRKERGEYRSGRGWIWGVVLVLIGALVLLQNFHLLTLNNWWALFILIPAIGALVGAWRAIKVSGGKFTRAARGELTVGIVLILITAFFLFNLNWSIWGPILIVLAGVAIIINALLPA